MSETAAAAPTTPSEKAFAHRRADKAHRDLEAGHGLLQRKLGWHEKFNVMRHNTGEAPVIVMVATLAVSRDTYDQGLQALEDALRERILALLEHPENGLLRSSVQYSTTKRPCFRIESSVDASGVLSWKGMIQAPSAEFTRASLTEHVMRAELRDASMNFRLEDSAPLWSVSLYRVEDEALAGEQPCPVRSAVVALAVHHCISDGKGSQALLNALLFGHIVPARGGDDVRSDRGSSSSGSSSEKPKTLASGHQSIPPTSNKTLPMNPPFFKLIVPLALTKFVMPKLAPVIPPPVRRMYTRKPAWPALRSKSNGKPSRNEPPVRWLSVVAPERTMPELRVVNYESPELVDGIKAVGKANGVATVHSTIHASMVVALAAALKAHGDTDEYVYASETPVDHRSPEALGHGTYTGNYIGVCWWREKISRSTSFWEIAKDYAALVSDEKKRRKALISIGLLKYLKATPVNDAVIPASTSDMVGVEAATGWEHWWHEKSKGRRPHRVSAGLSNLGVNSLDASVCEYGSGHGIAAETVAMFQCPSAIGPAIDVDVMGYKRAVGSNAVKKPQAGLMLSVSWRSGVVDASIPATFTQALASIGPLIGQGAFHSGITIGEAVDLLVPRLSATSSLASKQG
ncbi:unnamed protein product [Parajaminaea phylloscopi]